MSDEITLEEEFARTPLRRKTLGRIAAYVRPHRKRLSLALGLEVLWVVSMLLDVRLMRLTVDGPLAAGDMSGTWVFAGWMVLNVVCRAALTAFELSVTTDVGISVIHQMRQDVFDHVQLLSMRYFDRTKQGRIIARIDRDVETLEQLVMWGPIVVVSLLMSMIFGFTMILMQSPELGFWLLPALPIVWLTSRISQHFAFPPYRRQREVHSSISSHVAESITGVRVVKSFCAEARELARLDGMQKLYRQAVLAGARVAAAYIPTMSMTFHAVLIATFVIGGRDVVNGSMQIGQLIEFAFLLGFVLGPVEGLGALYNDSLIAGAAAERVFLLLDTEPEIQDADNAIDPGRLRGEVEFQSVSFSYDPAGEAGRQLHEVSFHVPAGSTIALVGPTGAGKTSITNLVSRFYEAQHGVVRIDGHDIREIESAALQRQLGIVLQESFLFAGTVLENLRFVKNALSLEEANAAFVELGVEEVLARFPDGLNTDVGERGANLSEGERQIVCFVRALIGRPAILVLDEATSAVDTRTERLILRALSRLAHSQTTFVIAHRLATIRDADRILVIEAGRIVESGSHDELMELGGAYAALQAQYQNAG